MLNSSSQRRLGPSPLQNLLSLYKGCFKVKLAGLGPSLRWDDGLSAAIVNTLVM